MRRWRLGGLACWGLCAALAGCSESDDAGETSTSSLVPEGAAGSESAAPGGGAGEAGSAGGDALADRFLPSDRGVYPSAGCGGNATPPVGTQTLITGGQEARYFITVPSGYDPNTPYPLVFVFHGADNTEVACRGQGNCLGAQMAFERQAITIYMKSIGTDWTNATKEENVAYFDDLLALTKASYCVDERRVVITGTSSGAHFSNVLGCRRGRELLAMAPVAGERLEKSGCTGSVAAILVHGVDDRSVAFALGEEARDHYAAANGCSGETVPPLADMHAEVRAARDAGEEIYRCVDYQGCSEGLPVRWCEHSVGGYDGSTHGWPLAAAQSIWDFVSPL